MCVSSAPERGGGGEGAERESSREFEREFEREFHD